MLNVIMMVPDTLSDLEAKNSPEWDVLPKTSEVVSAAKKRIQTTQRMNRSSDEQIIKSKELMSKGVRSTKTNRGVPELV